jgi:hypothetical protein
VRILARLWGINFELCNPSWKSRVIRNAQQPWRLGLWNTLILAAKVETLWNLGQRCFPEMMQLFEIYSQAIGTSEEDSVLETMSQVMPTRNFSSHLLECVPNEIAVMELSGVLWCDSEKPERIFETLRRIGKSAAFPLANAATGPT